MPVVKAVRFEGYDVALVDANGTLWTLVDADEGRYRKVDVK